MKKEKDKTINQIRSALKTFRIYTQPKEDGETKEAEPRSED